MTQVRTTIRPDLEIEVDATEHLDLQRMGLLLEDAPADAMPPMEAPAVPQPRMSTADTKSGKEE